MKHLHSDEEIKQPQWATEVPNRHPRIKYHTNVGHAKNAIIGKVRYYGPVNWAGNTTNPKADMYKYNSETGEWDHVYSLPPKVTRDMVRVELAELVE